MAFRTPQSHSRRGVKIIDRLADMAVPKSTKNHL